MDKHHIHFTFVTVCSFILGSSEPSNSVIIITEVDFTSFQLFTSGTRRHISKQ